MKQRDNIIPTKLADRSQRRMRTNGRSRQHFRLFGTLRIILGLYVKVIRLTLRGEYSRARRSEAIREFVESMGGLWIKMAQLLALRPDLFSAELCAELSKLHDQTTAFPFKDLEPEIEKSLGRPIPDIFSRFDEEPIAAASIGQVHRARLRREHKEVVVKVLKPDARALFAKDMRIITMIVRLLKLLNVAPQFRWDDLLKQLNGIVRAELDYRLELRSIDMMRRSLRRHRQRRVIIPKAYPNYSTSLLLTMEYLDGVFMSEVIQTLREAPYRFQDWCEENNVVPEKVARRLLLSTMRQVFEDNLFHGDLHPGNIVLFRDNKVGLIDFGSVGSLDRNFTVRYRIFLEAIAVSQFSKAADYMLMFSGDLPTLEIEGVRTDMAAAMQDWQTRAFEPSIPYHERSLAAMSDELNKVSLQYKIEPNWTLLKLGRTWSTLDASLYFLLPELNYFKMIRTYAREARRRSLRSLPAVLAALPTAGLELSTLLGPQLREAVLHVRAQASKGERIIAFILKVVGGLAILGLGTALWLYLSVHHDEFVFDDILHAIFNPIFGHMVDPDNPTITRIDEATWLLIIAGSLLLIYLLRRTIRILSEPPARRERE